LTARHVLKDEFKKNDLRTLGKSLFALYLTDSLLENGHFEGGLWPVNSINTIENIDIAVIQLKFAYRNGQPFYHSFQQLKLLPPSIGTNVLGLGYHDMQGIKVNTTRIEYSQELSASTGAIIEHFHTGRDSSMIPFPSFQVNCKFNSGMSGGPVFQEDGIVCGVICSSIDHEDGNNHISYVSSIWPAMALKVTINYSNGQKETLTLLELVKKGIIHTDDAINDLEINSVDNQNTSITIKLR
jgi:hypothetical protein